MSGKKFLLSCVLFLLRLTAAALPATYLTFCAMALAHQEMSSLPLRLFFYLILLWTYGGPLAGLFFNFPTPTKSCQFCIFWAIPLLGFITSCFFDLFASFSSYPKFGPFNPLTPGQLVKLLGDQLDDYWTAHFIVFLIKVVTLVAFAFILGGLFSAHLKISSALEPSSVRASTQMKEANTDSAKTKHLNKPKAQDQPPRYESVINMDLSPPANGDLPSNTSVRHV